MECIENPLRIPENSPAARPQNQVFIFKYIASSLWKLAGSGALRSSPERDSNHPFEVACGKAIKEVPVAVSGLHGS